MIVESRAFAFALMAHFEKHETHYMFQLTTMNFIKYRIKGVPLKSQE